MIEALPLGRFGAEFGIGAVIGGVIGYATGKVAKLLAVVIGAQLALFRFLETRGIIVVDYDRLSTGLLDTGGIVRDPGWVVPILSTLSIVLGFTVGFVFGYRSA